ncbi:MAG: DNA polymerase/3'-5' exonuclease PolX [Vicinamibacterales bacterium]
MPGLENAGIARALGEIGDLLEIRGDNPFKIRAYRNAADMVAQSGERVADLDEAALREWPGIGKDLATRIRELAQTGTCAIRDQLLQEFPPTLLDVLRLQGVGPKTVALLYKDLRIASLDDLEAAARAGRLRGLKGMGPKKEQLLLKALDEQRKRVGRHLLADTSQLADSLVRWLRERAPEVDFEPVGSLRRGVDTCGDLDILAVGGDPSLMATFTGHPDVERILGQGETKSSVLIRGGFQVDLRLVAPASRGAALQYFTGSKAHNIVLRDRALARGLRLNEYGLFRADDETQVAGDDEAGIYAALGLALVPPELRENRGEVEAAETGTLPALLEERHLRGDVHMHTTETDGRDSLEAMVAAARALGHEYIAITDHSQALAMANGLDETRALAHARRIRELDARTEGITVLAGIECDILPDGRMDLADDCLAELDLVIASVHSAMQQDEAEMTDRMFRAIENPWVDILGHPTNRLLLRREASKAHMGQVIDHAAHHGVAMEINCQVDRLDLNDAHARLARERGVKLLVSTDAHATAALALRRWGVVVARRAWAGPADVLNTLPLARFRKALRRHRKSV